MGIAKHWSKWVINGAIVAGFSIGTMGAAVAAEPAMSPLGKYVPFKEAFKTNREMNIWKRMYRKTDELLRPPFDKAPPDTVKGLASKIRAEELDVKNRVLAVEYLGKVDCVAYPEAQEMLIDMLHNDKWEEVRYAAALALQNMLTNCCNNGEKDTTDRDKLGRYDECRGCCNKDVLNALAKTAYEYDEHACCFEPSLRVREAAVEAIKACCIPCNYGPYMAPSEVPATPPEEPKTEEVPKGEEKPMQGGEEKPTPSEEKPADGDAKPAKEALLLPLPFTTQAPTGTQQKPVAAPPAKVSVPSTLPAASAAVNELSAYPVVDALKGYCVVALKARMFVKAKPELYSIHKGIRYHFWSDAAKAEFDRIPESYAVQFNGADPVELAKGNHVVGQFLRDHEDRFYLFSSKENWEVFKGNPTAYMPHDALAPQTEIVRVGSMGKKLESEASPALHTRMQAR